jgi:tRNA pseudouridine13 synthase|tara:strand:- start:17092 stop:18156 length:1065 start_codon:yes stop_codon:yes gene_type:complete
MQKIKQIPEDFIVREINDTELNETGQYSYFLLKKKNYNTLRAVQRIAENLRISEKSIGFAGNKDKNAVTEQVISVKNGNKDIEDLLIKDIKLEYLGKGNEEIYPGKLRGNDFEITIRNLEKRDIDKIRGKTKNDNIFMPNYFGEQRFSSSNDAIGREIIKNDFNKAIELILESNTDYNEKIKVHLEKCKNDYIGALKLIPVKLLKLYVHAYQSFLFNKTLEIYINSQKQENNENNNQNEKNDEDDSENNIYKKNIINVKIPIIGFGTEIENKEIEGMIEKIMEEEKINYRDFIIRPFPELSSEGDERNAFVRVDDFEIENQGKDELNKDKEKIKVKFSLAKGCYATVLVDWLFG